jgi:hypothetical protein
MKKILSAVFVLVIFVFAMSMWPQGKDDSSYVLSDSKLKPVADGKVAKDEYSLTVKLKNGEVDLSRSGGTISFGVSFKTTGWIAIGFGTQGMDKSHMVLCYVKDGTAVVKEQNGARHRHEDVEKSLLVKKAGFEADGTTTLEGELLLASVSAPDAKSLPVIVAYGAEDNFTSMHSYKSAFTVTLN